MEQIQLTVCTDCHLTHNGYDSHELGYTPEVEPWGLANPFDAAGAGYGRPHFSNSPCGACGNDLAGDRYDYVLFI